MLMTQTQCLRDKVKKNLLPSVSVSSLLRKERKLLSKMVILGIFILCTECLRAQKGIRLNVVLGIPQKSVLKLAQYS